MIVEVHGQAGGMRVQFEARLQAQCTALGIPLVLVDGNAGTPAATPQVAVVFPAADPAWLPADAALHPQYADASFPVLPVIIDAPEAQFLPASLCAFNAFQRGIWQGAWPDGLVDEVLSLGWQRRRERRVFISYKRTDSGPVARQLHAELTRCGYMAFLDDISIPKGVEFQRELKWWLNDADVVIVLVSPNFENSNWCMEEIAFAQSSLIGLLGVAWPDSVMGDSPTRLFPAGSSGVPTAHSVLKAMDPDQRLQLVDSDFDGGPAALLAQQELSDQGLAKTLAWCARQRAQAIRLRLENLVPLAERVLKPKAGLQPVGEPGDYTFVDGGGVNCYVRLLPFRPDPRSVQDTFTSAAGHRRVGCFYNESDLTDPRAKAMEWLTAGPRQATKGAARQRTTLWACVGDKVVP